MGTRMVSCFRLFCSIKLRVQVGFVLVISNKMFFSSLSGPIIFKNTKWEEGNDHFISLNWPIMAVPNSSRLHSLRSHSNLKSTFECCKTML